MRSYVRGYKLWAGNRQIATNNNNENKVHCKYNTNSTDVSTFTNTHIQAHTQKQVQYKNSTKQYDSKNSNWKAHATNNLQPAKRQKF